MSCDYYIIIHLVIDHTKNCQPVKEYLELGRMRMYYLFKNSNEEYNEMSEIYKKFDRLLYTNNRWTTQNEETINEYMECLKENNIDLSDVIRIEKKHYCQKV